MRTLSRYFVARFLALFFAILFSSTLAIATVEMLVNLDDMLRTGSGYSGALNYLFLRIPSYYGQELLPISGFAAGLLCFGLAGHHRETLAARAGGLSLFQVTAPVLLAATGLATLAFALNETWILERTRTFAHHQAADLDLRLGTFWYRRGHTIYNMGALDLEQQDVADLDLYELNPEGRLQRRIQAATGQLQPEGDWELQDVVIQTFRPDAPPQAPTVTRAESLRIEIDSPGRGALVASNAKALGVGHLFEAIQARKRHHETHVELASRLQLRLAGPASFLVLCLAGLVLGLQVERTRSLGTPVVIGSVVLAVFYATRNSVETLSLAAVLPSWAIWVLLLIFGLAGLLAFSRSPR